MHALRIRVFWFPLFIAFPFLKCYCFSFYFALLLDFIFGVVVYAICVYVCGRVLPPILFFVWFFTLAALPGRECRHRRLLPTYIPLNNIAVTLFDFGCLPILSVCVCIYI